MPLPSFRSSRSKVRRRRSHHALKPISTVTCASCGEILIPHRACKACGAYGNRNVKKTGLDAVKKILDKKVASTEAPTENPAAKTRKAVATKRVTKKTE